MNEWSETLQALMERAQGLHEAIGTIPSFSLTYRRIQHNYEMVLTKPFLV